MASELSPRDRDLMIRTIIGEAGNQGPQGQAAVAHVIANRVAAGNYGKTPAAVVMAPGQFEPWQIRKQELLSIDPKSAAYQNAGDIVDMSQSGDIPDPTGGATHFLQPDIVRQRRGGTLPGWAQQPTATIGQHQFFAPNGRVGVDPLDAINRAMTDPGTP
jgi:spore germination cell wall hydrolase CwlJ-like protein